MTNKAKSTTSKTSKTKATTKSRSKTQEDKAILATCPVNGEGWCPYPFSISQLKKRLKAKELAAKAGKEAS